MCYYRVSTDKQGERGLGIASQKAAVRKYLQEVNGVEVGEGYIDVESGRRKDRPQLDEALRQCRLWGATLCVAKLDRLSRDAEFLLKIVRESGERGVVFCDMRNIPEGEAGKMLIVMLASVAALEAEMISKRTKSALAQIKRELAEKGKRVSKAGRVHTRLGNPHPEGFGAYGRKGGLESVKVRREKVQERVSDLLPVVDIIRAKGIVTLQGIADELNRRGHRAPRGGRWATAQVWHLLRHVDAQDCEVAA